jgi:hypothetical protein
VLETVKKREVKSLVWAWRRRSDLNQKLVEISPDFPRNSLFSVLGSFQGLFSKFYDSCNFLLSVNRDSIGEYRRYYIFVFFLLFLEEIRLGSGKQ